MTKLGINFIKASLIYFIVGTTMGAIMSIEPIHDFILMSHLFERAHSHITLIGWVSLAIIGFTYFFIELSRPLHSQKLGEIGFWLINIGIIFEFIVLIIGGYVQSSAALRGESIIPFTTFVAIFAFIMLTGCYISVYNIYKTIMGYSGHITKSINDIESYNR